MKPALMIIDMQKAYFTGASKESMTEACEYINEVLGYFRESKLPVVWVQHQEIAENVIPGSIGFEVIDLLAKQEGEIGIIKEYGNSFNKTDCAGILKDLGVDTVIITGYCAENCVLSTCRGALDWDLTPFLLKNGIASGNRKNLEAVYRISDTIPYRMVGKLAEQNR